MKGRGRAAGLLLAAALLLLAAGCGAPGADRQPQEKLQVVTTFSILQDIVDNVGGHRVETYSLVPKGTDPHEYQPLPQDIRKAVEADVLFWNGLNMETGDGWFHRLVEVAGKTMDGGQVFELAAGIEPLYLTDGDQREINPHAFLDVGMGIRYVENARDALMQVDPDHADVYAENAAAYIAELEEIRERYRAKLGSIPAERRYLVTSERAFQYLAQTFELTEGYIWQIDTEEQGTPEQILSLVNFIRENRVPALLLESNVDPRPMQAVSAETGVPIVNRIYSDELGAAGSGGGTYVEMLEWNLNAIYEALRPQD